MNALLQAALALLAAIGLLALGWWTLGRVMTPAPWSGPVYVVVPAAGSGAHLEQDVKGLLWLRKQQRGSFTIVIADEGLNPSGRAIAAALLTDATGVVVCPATRLGEYITEK